MSAALRQPAPTPFDQIGGRAGVRHLADRFYELMETSPAYAELRALHAADLAPVRTALAGFLEGWLGGPRDWFTQRGGFCVMSAHARLAITPQTAGQWTAAMARALEDCGIDPKLASRMNEIFQRMAQGMAQRVG